MGVHLAKSVLGRVYRRRVVVSGEASVVVTLDDCLALRLSDHVYVVGGPAAGEAAVE